MFYWDNPDEIIENIEKAQENIYFDNLYLKIIEFYKGNIKMINTINTYYLKYLEASHLIFMTSSAKMFASSDTYQTIEFTKAFFWWLEVMIHTAEEREEKWKNFAKVQKKMREYNEYKNKGEV